MLRRTTASPRPASGAAVRSMRARPATSAKISQTCRKMAECIFGWGKQHGTMRKTKHRGIAAVSADFMLNLIAYNLVRIPKRIAAGARVCPQARKPAQTDRKSNSKGRKRLGYHRYFSKLLGLIFGFRN